MPLSDWTEPRPTPSLTALLDDPRSAIWPPRADQTLARFRQRLDAPLAAVTGPELPLVADIMAAGGDGAAAGVPLRLYRPSLAANLPIVMFVHGGGFVAGSLETHDALCRSLALHSGAAVISVEYRLAPEAPYPAALDDCVTALRWISCHASARELDPGRIALCGDSAGGQLAIATALRVRGEGICLRHLGLVYPVIDPECDSRSAHAFAEGHILTRSAMQWFWQCYAGMDIDPRNPLLNVMGAKLDGLPPTTILTAELDLLRDEGEAFARCLQASEVSVIARRYLSMPHGFISLGALTPIAGHAIADLASDLRVCFDRR
jgi:acetyl esterase